jgi:hypothetical protein
MYLPATSNIGDMILENGCHGALVVDLGNPTWQLRMPEEGMPTDKFAVLLGKIDNSIATTVAELVTVWLSSIPKNETGSARLKDHVHSAFTHHFIAFSGVI